MLFYGGGNTPALFVDMLTLSELQELFGVPTLVQLSNDDPNADPNDPANINTSLVNMLITEFEAKYKDILVQFPQAKYDCYRLIILELHKRRAIQGNKAFEDDLAKEYEIITNRLNSYRYLLMSLSGNKTKWG